MNRPGNSGYPNASPSACLRCRRVCRPTLATRYSQLATHRSAFTLIELLLALSLAGTVLTLATRIATRSLRTRQVVADGLDAQAQDDFVVDSMAADLAARLPGQSFSVLLDANRRPLIQIRCLAAEPGGDLHTSRLPADVQYRLVRMPGDSLRLRLERVVHWLAKRNGGQITRTTVGRDLAEFEVTLHDGQGWCPLPNRRTRDELRWAAFYIRFRGGSDGAAVRRTFVVDPPNPKDRGR